MRELKLQGNLIESHLIYISPFEWMDSLIGRRKLMERLPELTAHSYSSVLDKALVGKWLIQKKCMWNYLPETEKW